MSVLSGGYGSADKGQNQNQMVGIFGGISDAGVKEFAGDHFQEREKSQQKNR